MVPDRQPMPPWTWKLVLACAALSTIIGVVWGLAWLTRGATTLTVFATLVHLPLGVLGIVSIAVDRKRQRGQEVAGLAS